MEDLSVAEKVQEITRLAESQAIAEMASPMNDSVVIDDPSPSAGSHVPKETHTTYTTVVECPYHSIDITDGQFHNISYGNISVQTDSTSSIESYGSLYAIGPEILTGVMSHTSKTTGSTNVTTRYGRLYDFSDSPFPKYYYSKLDNVKLVYKDFMVQIERTSAGGIQFKDEPILEVGVFPTDRAGTAVTEKGLPIFNFIIKNSTFTRSFPMLYSSYGRSNMQIHVYSVTPGGQIDYAFGRDNTAYVTPMFQPLGELLDPAFATVTTGFDDYAWIVPKGWKNEVTAIRCRNIPPGVTNVECRLKYTVEVHTTWSSTHPVKDWYFPLALNNDPIPFVKQDSSMVMNYSKKRKHNDEEILV